MRHNSHPARRNPNFSRRKPVPTYLPSPQSPAHSLTSASRSPASGNDNNLSQLVDPEWQQNIAKRLHRRHEVGRNATGLIFTAESLTLTFTNPPPGLEVEQFVPSTPQLLNPVPRISHVSSPRPNRRPKSIHKTYHPPTPPRRQSKVLEHELRAFHETSSSEASPEMRQFTSPLISLSPDSNRYPDLHPKATMMSSGEDTTNAVHGAGTHDGHISTRFTFPMPRRASACGDSVLSHQSLGAALRQARGWGRMVRCKLGRLFGLTVPPRAVTY